ncbi:hypothetical protein Drose_15605 [Dactylosporangium roseum]|uniref:TOTE conflict system primase domain-containing protein n=2 Tax=Dactylosporangium roseum TaxID=47989 RepID=A0ABY5ZHD6_9ACTN|nr:hypothetical protein [Dactylosporangium roseum]UWZ40852.1 hypothetical protein Drose_15605 [Dactylosporangium roseum]
MDLASYDRLFPNQDVLPDGGFGNLIAAPLHGVLRRDGLTAFLDDRRVRSGAKMPQIPIVDGDSPRRGEIQFSSTYPLVRGPGGPAGAETSSGCSGGVLVFVGGGVGDVHSSGGVFDDGRDIQWCSGQGDGLGEVRCDGGLGL